jgi:hypothetical protein
MLFFSQSIFVTSTPVRSVIPYLIRRSAGERHSSLAGSDVSALESLVRSMGA